jgi:hypothetical protein
MTFGATSAIFQQSILNPIGHGISAASGFPAGYVGLGNDDIRVALFNDTTTPSKTAAVASTGYNTGVWITANEVIDTLNTNWVAGGRTIASKALSVDAGSSSLCFQAAAIAGAGNVTITNAFGCLVYDFTVTGGVTVAKQGMCYNSFGGSAQGVTNGTFTVLWATVGALTNVVIFNITV